MNKERALFFISAALGMSCQIFDSIFILIMIVFFVITSYQFFSVLEIKDNKLKNEKIMLVIKMGGLFVLSAMFGQFLA